MSTGQFTSRALGISESHAGSARISIGVRAMLTPCKCAASYNCMSSPFVPGWFSIRGQSWEPAQVTSPYSTHAWKRSSQHWSNEFKWANRWNSGLQDMPTAQQPANLIAKEAEVGCCKRHNKFSSVLGSSSGTCTTSATAQLNGNDDGLTAGSRSEHGWQWPALNAHCEL